ncbi:hypothetical protein SLEP1_g21554 [Rubroshorea leprosula]|uniref:F-box domain-containing protein n=1 Tax=Rubroshorea leprosula TaxID=152421 RepID=A0AAV5JFK3_9ROSI|nr:hypothetical protein SLEP1_g21554 [Rubroshorea leprosula]
MEEGMEEGSNCPNNSAEDAPYCPTWLKGRAESLEHDRISALPDSVIHYILSFLPTMDSIKTSVLSKTWVKLWSFVPNLSVHVLDLDHPDKLFRIIHGTLIFYSSTKIKKFLLHFDYHRLVEEIPKSNMDSHIDLWVRFATERNAEELCLEFGSENDLIVIANDSENGDMAKEKGHDRYTMPQFLYDYSSMTKLSSTGCDYMPKGQVSWRHLKVLTTGKAVLTNDNLQRILSGSPMLEGLKLCDCWDITSVDVSLSGSLKKLVIDGVCDPSAFGWIEEYTMVEISGPNLKSLEILGSWQETKCRLLNVSSLMDAHVNFVSYSKGIFEFDEFAETALSMADYRGLLSPLINGDWKCLTLYIRNVKEFVLPGVAFLLQNSPKLEKVVVDTENVIYDIHNHISIHPTGDDFWTLQERSFGCLLQHLKTIEFVDLVWGKYDYDGYLLGAFMQFLLRNARVLEKMAVHYSPWAFLVDDAYDSDEAARILLSFPRASPHAVILVSASPMILSPASTSCRGFAIQMSLELKPQEYCHHIALLLSTV